MQSNNDNDAIFLPCLSPDALHLWLQHYLKLKVPRTHVCANHCAPFDYLWRAYHEPTTDLIVWASRAGGKTRLGAAATLLDALHKPTVQIRILGGSFEQSLKMWEYLADDVQRLELGKIRNRRILFPSGSTVGVLTQSQRCVRGVHVEKMRCDEVEMFTPEVWEAAQLVTKSSKVARGSIEALSTMHKSYGVMNKVIERANESGTPVLRWCILEVLEKCVGRECSTCPLHEECGGIAKEKCDGYLAIDDAIAMKRRVSRETWESEMLCRRPSTEGSVFGSFDMDVHVKEVEGKANWLAVDFGYANPFVCLWIADEGTQVKAIDEYVMRGKVVAEHVEELRKRWGDVRRVACDPAGNGRSEQTGESTITILRRNGYTVKNRHSGIMDGIERVRAALCSGDRKVSLVIHPRCRELIKAMRCYRVEEGSERPVKDGENDHAVDALRYFFVNREGMIAASRRY
jgi:hypothetical protein